MIVSKIQGGIGNQLFQYAFGRHISYKNNLNFYLDKSFYNFQTNVIRKFELDRFNSTYTYFDIETLNNIPLYRINDDFVYKEYMISNNAHYYIDGFWQSEKYFIESESIIRSDFAATNEKMENILSRYPQLSENSTSIHIRRTDYVKSNGYHPVQSMDYYEKGLESIGGYDNLFVFSDDIKWCRENLKFENMIFIEGNDDIDDLYTMSMCRNNIIANSSFSWWGAWLNNNIEKKVIAPSNWFGPQANLNTSDIIPEKWIKL